MTETANSQLISLQTFNDQTVAYRGKTLGPEPVNANFFSSQILSLPVAEHSGATEVNYVCAKIIEFDSEYVGSHL